MADIYRMNIAILIVCWTIGATHAPVDVNRLLMAVSTVESGNNDRAYNSTEHAAGRYQIRPIYLKDVNRICRLRGLPCFSAEDRYNPAMSRQIVLIYWRHYAKTWTIDELCTLHNAGPTANMDCTRKYRHKVKIVYKSL